MANDIHIKIIIDSKGNLKDTATQMKKVGDETKKTDSATKKLGKTRDNYNRKEKGAAQISSNQTKNFSKMQQTVDGGGGAGGLVRAYALLAANVFALTAAFGVLARSAQIDTLNQSMEILSTTGGVFIKNIAREMQAASGFAIDLAQSFRQVSLASSAGLSTKEIEGLTTVARGAAISLGRNLPDAMDRIFRGAIKLEPEILDEIGLFVRVDEAAQKYARNNGKVVSALTQTEKRQAFLNEILEQGTKKFAEYAEEIQPDAYSKLGAALGDIAQDFLSFANAGLGPMINVLAEVRGLLVIGFVGLVTYLLSKALPAMGLFAKSQAESASIAAKNAREYTNSLKDATDLQIAEENERTQNEINELEKRRQARMKFNPDNQQGPKSRAAGADKIDKRLKRNEKGQKRMNALIKKEEQLKEQINNSGEKSSKLLEKDLRNLRKEQGILKDILQKEKQIADNQERGKKAINPNSLAFARQGQLDQRAGAAGIVSSAVGVGETQSFGEGWKTMNTDIAKGFKTVDEAGDKVEKQFTNMQKASIKVKTGFGLVGNSINKLMISLGPYLMLFSMLLPLFVIFAKRHGFMSKAAKEFDAEITKSIDLMETFAERSKTQIEGMADTETSFLENVRAQLAFSKSQKQVSEQILKLNKSLEAFQTQSTDAVRKWERFKAIFGLDRETKMIQQQLSMVEKQIRQYIAAGDNTLAEVLLGDMNSVEQFAMFDKAILMMKEVNQFDALSGGMTLFNAEQTKEQGIIMRQVAERAADIQGLLKRGQTQAAASYIEMIDAEGILTKEMKTRILASNMLATTLKHGTKVETFRGVTLTDIAGKTANLIAIETERARRLGNFISATEGARESVGKFQASFLPKTKVDDILSSLLQVQTSITELGETFDVLSADGTKTIETITNLISPEKFQKFFSEFERDNPIYQLFSPEQVANIKKWSTETDGGVSKAIDLFQEIIEKVTEYQKTLQLAVIETKRLTEENKTLQKVIDKGVQGGEKFALNSIKIAQQKVLQADTELDMTIMALKVSEKQADTIRAIVKGTETRAQLEQKLKELGMSQLEMFSITSFTEKARLARLEETISLRNKENLILQQNIKAQMAVFKVEKEIIGAQQEALTIRAKLSNMASKGSMGLTSSQETRIALKTAENTLNIAQQEAKFKADSAIIELEILQMRMRVIKEENNTLAAKARLEASIAKDNLNFELSTSLLLEAQNLEADARRLKSYEDGFNEVINKQTTLLDQTLKNSAGNFMIALFDAANNAATKGLVSGVKASVAVIGAITTEKGTQSLNALEQLAKDRVKTLNANADTADAGGDADLAKTLRDRAAGVTVETEKNAQRQAAAFGLMRNAALSYAESLKQFGREGQLMSAVVSGGIMIQDAFANMHDEIQLGASGLGLSAEKAEFAATAISAVGSILAANAQNQVSKIDEQIEAEKRRDGKSKESLAKVAGMEKKKEAVQRKAFDTQKKIQIASTIAATAASVMQVMSAPGDPYKVFGIPMSGMIAALGAAQVAIIARQKYGGGSAGDVPKPATSLSIGKRNNTVDVSRGANSGELSYLRGARGTGNANNFNPSGGATGMKSYAAGGEGILVGEQGPEIVAPSVPVDVIPNSQLGGSSNVNFTINAVDAAGVEDLLVNQRGNIIRMIREAANDTGERFLETVDTQAYGSNT